MHPPRNSARDAGLPSADVSSPRSLLAGVSIPSSTQPVRIDDPNRVRGFLEADPVENAFAWHWTYQQRDRDVHADRLPPRALLTLSHGTPPMDFRFGTVTAASEWDGPPERKHIRQSLTGSYERMFHDSGIPRFLLSLRDPALAHALEGPHLERAIGVLYIPRTERQSHYFYARLAQQFDFVIHIDETRALEPLERSAGWEAGEMAETYPTGL